MFSIKNLYLGNYVPIESICDSDNSKEALRTVCDCEAKLNCSLSNEQKALLETKRNLHVSLRKSIKKDADASFFILRNNNSLFFEYCFK